MEASQTITAADVAHVPAAMTAPEPPSPPPHGFERIKAMVEKGGQLVDAGVQAGTVEFNKAEGLDWHGFRAWVEAHGEETGVGAEEIAAVEARAVVDPDVETAEAKAEREAKERAEETLEAKTAREEWEFETGRTTHFSVNEDGSPRETLAAVVAEQSDGAKPPATPTPSTPMPGAEPAQQPSPAA